MDKIYEVLNGAARLPERMPDFTPANGGAALVTAQKLSRQARETIEFWKPLMEKHIDWDQMPGSAAHKKAFRAQNELVVAHLLTQFAKQNKSTLTKEATTAGSDIPTYAKQQIAIIMRAFPRLFALQLFGVTPLSQRDGRIWFMEVLYNSAYTGSVPNIASGDRVDDLTKFNKEYVKTAEGVAAKKLKLNLTSMSVEATSNRVTSDWTYEAEEDFASGDHGTLDGALVDWMAHLVNWTTDRDMIDAALANAGTTATWDATPSDLDGGGAGTTGYDQLTPSEQKAFDERIWSHALLPLITDMQKKRAYNTTPSWAVVGSNASELIQRLSTFVPVATNDGTAIDLSVGAMRDVGTLRNVGIRVIVDPQMDENKILLGHKPVNSFDPVIHYCPYKALRVTGVLEKPNTGDYEKGVYSRYAKAVPNTGSNAASSQLGDAYGVLTITP